MILVPSFWSYYKLEDLEVAYHLKRVAHDRVADYFCNQARICKEWGYHPLSHKTLYVCLVRPD